MKYETQTNMQYILKLEALTDLLYLKDLASDRNKGKTLHRLHII